MISVTVCGAILLALGIPALQESGLAEILSCAFSDGTRSHSGLHKIP
jgi:hypothetical protein